MQVFRFKTFYSENRSCPRPQSWVTDAGMWLALLLAIVLPSHQAAAQSPPLANGDLFFSTEGFAVPLSVLANDNDADGDLDTASLSITIPASNGSTSINPSTGVITYLPNPHFHGFDEFTYRISDLSGLSATAQVTLLVYPVNDAPLLLPDVDSTLEGTPVFVKVLLNDSDSLDLPLSNINPLTLSIATPPLHGSATALPGVTGRVLYQPSPGFFGVDSFAYSVCDNGHPLPALCGTAWVRVYVFMRVVAAADASICLGDSVRLTATGPGPYTWSPAEGLSCTNCIAPWASPTSTTTYTVTTTAGGCCPNSDSLNVVVIIPGTVQAIDDLDALNEDGNTTVDALNNDVLIDGFELVPLGGALHGTSSWSPEGTLTYTAAANFYGMDSVAYAVCPPACPSGCDTGWVVLHILPVNDTPLAVNDTAYGTQDMPLYSDLLAGDSDVDGNLMYSNMSLLISTLNGSINITDSGVVYQPNPGFTGWDSLQYQICDDGYPLPAECASAWLFIRIEELPPPPNEAPVAAPDLFSVWEDSSAMAEVLLNDMDPEGMLDTLSLALVGGPHNGSADWLGSALRYTPLPNYYGQDSLRYAVCDLGDLVRCDSTWVYIEVMPINDPPLVRDDNATVLAGQSVLVALLANDSDLETTLDPWSLELLQEPAHGTWFWDGDAAALSYTAASEYLGPDSLLYRICDLGFPLPALCDSAWVRIAVEPQRNAEAFYAMPDFFSLEAGQELLGELLANDHPQAESFCMELLRGPSLGTGYLEPNGKLRYTSSQQAFGTDSLRYRVCNGEGLWAEANVLVTVRLGGLEIAGGLSPNGDGRNENFRIVGLEHYPNHHLQIVNRRGDLLLDTAPYNNDWDGRYNGKELPEGTYFYLLTLDPAQPGSVLSGHLTLRR